MLFCFFFPVGMSTIKDPLGVDASHAYYIGARDKPQKITNSVISNEEEKSPLCLKDRKSG